MYYFANPSGPAVRQAMQTTPWLKMIATPKQQQAVPEGVIFCADNGCGPGKTGGTGKGWPGEKRWLEWLASYTEEEKQRCLFAVAPDVLGDARATLERSRPYLPILRELGFPAALVTQDGIENTRVPWDEFDVLFIGGSDRHKLGAVARELTAQAVGLGKRVHMGRVNSEIRLLYAQAIGCSTADGTKIKHGPDIHLPTVLGWLERANERVALVTS